MLKPQTNGLTPPRHRTPQAACTQATRSESAPRQEYWRSTPCVASI
ncbi:hypothetical protein [Lysobacter gummosus]